MERHEYERTGLAALAIGIGVASRERKLNRSVQNKIIRLLVGRPRRTEEEDDGLEEIYRESCARAERDKVKPSEPVKIVLSIAAGRKRMRD